MIKKSLIWAWKTSKGFKKGIVTNTLWGICGICASMAFIWTSKCLIDIATHNQQGKMSHYIILLISMGAAQLIFWAINYSIENKSNILFKNRLKYKLFDWVMSSTWNGKEKYHTGDVVNRLEEDIRLVSDTLTKTIYQVIVILFQIVAAFVFLAYLEPYLAWVLVIITPLFLMLSKLYLKHMRRISKEIRTLEGNIQIQTQENLQHKVLIQTLEQNESTTQKLGGLQQKLMKFVIERVNLTIFSRTLITLGFMSGYILAFIWGVMGIYKGALTFGVMTALLQLVGQIQRPILQLSTHIPALATTFASIERLMELEELPIENVVKRVYLENNVGLKIEDISFTYPDGDKEVIAHFSHNFQPQSKTAIMGETGIGKSTLIRLVLSLLRPQSGKIYVYNSDQQVEIDASTRCNLVFVPQGNTLLSGTIKENLLMGNPQAGTEELQQALKTAAAEFVFELPLALDTPCGERGAGLSEGQAQRICIARGLLRPGAILLLDEFSSSLDVDTETLLMQRLLEYAKDKTIIFVTHHKQIMAFCDKVIDLSSQK